VGSKTRERLRRKLLDGPLCGLCRALVVESFTRLVGLQSKKIAPDFDGVIKERSHPNSS